MAPQSAAAAPGRTMRDRLVALPGPVWTLALWCAITFFAGVVIPIVFDVTDRAVDSTGYLWTVAAALDVAFIVCLLALGARTPVLALHAIVIVKALLTLASAAQKATDFGVVVSAIGLIWVVLYAALWWPRTVAFGYAVGTSAGLLVVIAFDGSLALLGYAWALLTLVLLSVAAAVSYIVRQLDRLSTLDALTGLLNRNALDEYLELYSTVGRGAAPRALVVIDLDGLKLINDTQGHAAGDAFLVRFASHLRRRVRAGDLIFRIGGDEFLLVLPKTPGSWVGPLVARMREQTPIQWSCGWADWPNGEDFDAAFAVADERMYADKAANKGLRS